MSGQRNDLVLALYPNARGFAYVIFEGSSCPVDWGVSDVLHKKGRISACVRRLSELIDWYQPDCLVLRDVTDDKTSSAKILASTAEDIAGRKGLATYRMSRKDVRRAFGHLRSPTRSAIAETITKHIPMFAPLLPPARKIWNGEDRRMGLFDAAALALTLLSHNVFEESSAAVP
jgi:hypothetical protein